MNTRAVIVCAFMLSWLFAWPVQGEIIDLYKQAREEQNVDRAVELYWQYFNSGYTNCN